jgi:radical SAM superfamily enzyme YgiQ (UPF0313 family)
MIQLFATEFKGYIGENVGVGRLKAFMEKNNEEVVLSYLGFSKKFEEQKNVLVPNCKLYGFSVYNNNLEYFMLYINEIKRIQSDAIIVVGSKFATTYYKEILQEFENIDYVILGDGEYALLDLVKSINEKSSIDKLVFEHNNIASRKSLENKRPAILDIEKLPWADRTFIKENNYMHAYVCDCHGCIGRCSFCAQANYYSRWNGRSAEDLYDEVVHINEECGIYRFIFTGGSFEDPGTLGKKKIRDLCMLLKKNNKKFVFRCFLRADTFIDNEADRELLSLMRSCGLKIAAVGIEAGNDEDLRIYNKRASLQQNRETIKLLKKMDIYTGGFGFIMFNPYSKRKNISLNYQLLVENEISDFFRYTSKLMLIGDTEIYERVKKDGLLTIQGTFYQEDGLSYDFKEPDIVEIWKFVEDNLLTNEISEMSNMNEDYAEFVISFYEYLENGEVYKNEMLKIKRENAELLRVFFHYLYEKYDIEKCKEILPQMLSKYKKNTNSLVHLRNKMLIQLMKALKLFI